MRAIRASFVHCLGDPGDRAEPDQLEYFDDGLLLLRGNRVERLAPAAALLPELPAELPVGDYRGYLVTPGFIDAHVHYPQTDMIAAHGEQLLQWLNRYTFPTERRFADLAHAREVADFFLDELLRNGTTTALVLPTVHRASVDGLFAAARARDLRMIAGKVLMDRNAPPDLLDDPDSAAADSRALIEAWHGQGRLRYAITPRFAPTSSDAQLGRAGELAAEYPEVYLHTHLAENREELAWVARLFPWSRSYLDVYERFGLLRERSVFAHCLHLDPLDRQRLAERGGAMVFCPTSNLFLGSGLFDLAAADAVGAPVAVGTDVGGGTSFSLLRTLGEAYKVLQLGGQSLGPARALYLATLGGARALCLDDCVGSFQPGREADFVVIDPGCTPLLRRRLAGVDSILDRLFVLMMLGDDRAVLETWINGRRAWRRPEVGAA